MIFTTASHLSNFFVKLFLNLLELALFGFNIWSGIRLFSGHDFLKSQTIGSLVFIAEIIFFFVVGWQNSRLRRQPSMILTILVLAIVFFVFAYAGVQPMSTYKNNMSDYVNKALNSKQNDISQPSATVQPSTSEPVIAQPSYKLPSGIYSGMVGGWIPGQLIVNGDIMTECYGTNGFPVETFKLVWHETILQTETFVATDVTDSTQTLTINYVTQYDIITIADWFNSEFSKPAN